jgi:hypothetical protein
MVQRSRTDHAEDDGGVRRSSSETWWDCSCGRSVADFSATTSGAVHFTIEDDGIQGG